VNLLSDDFFQHFCLLFSIGNLNNTVEINVQVENEQASLELYQFYLSTIDYIQLFLFTNNLISVDEHNRLSQIFSKMKFSCVDKITIQYKYRDNVCRGNKQQDVYIDLRTNQFYILKEYEHSELRYIDAIVDFILTNESADKQLKLTLYIKKILQIYQRLVFPKSSGLLVTQEPL
ncbi:unnamed protein product, partial [Didymodactylos carnosus]